MKWLLILRIKKYEVDNANIKQDLLTLSKKITQISSKIKLSFTNPLSLVASPNDSIRKSNFNFNITDDIPIRELIKRSESEFNDIFFILNSKANDSQKIRTSLSDISSSLNDIVKFTNKTTIEDNEINIINGTNNPINLLEDSNRTLSVKSMNSNVHNSNNALFTANSNNSISLNSNEIIVSIVNAIENIKNNLDMPKTTIKPTVNGRAKVQQSKTNVDLSGTEGELKDSNIVNYLNDNIQFLSNGLDGRQLTFDNNNS